MEKKNCSCIGVVLSVLRRFFLFISFMEVFRVRIILVPLLVLLCFSYVNLFVPSSHVFLYAFRLLLDPFMLFSWYVVVGDMFSSGFLPCL